MKLVTKAFAIFSIAMLVIAAGCGETTEPAPAGGGGDEPAAGADENGEGGEAGENETGSTGGVSEATTTQVSYSVEGMR